MWDNQTLLTSIDVGLGVVLAASIVAAWRRSRAASLFTAEDLDVIATRLSVRATPVIAGTLTRGLLNAMTSPTPSLSPAVSPALSAQSDVMPLPAVPTVAAPLETFQGFPGVLSRMRDLVLAPPSALLVPAGAMRFIVQIEGLGDKHTDDPIAASSWWDANASRTGLHKYWDREQHVPLRAERHRAVVPASRDLR